MPCDYSEYPADWKAISLRIRRRAGNKCEQCNAPNHAFIIRQGDVWKTAYHLVRPYLQHDEHLAHLGMPPQWSNPHNLVRELKTRGHNIAYVILTVAHIGAAWPDGAPGDKHDKHDVRQENLKALCQRCHLRLDLNDHITNRKYGRHFRRAQIPLFT